MIEKSMRKYYIYISVLTLIYLIVLVKGLSQIENPFQARSAKHDVARVTSLKALKTRIEDYYSKQNHLPENLVNLTVPEATLKDSVSNQYYQYRTVNDVKYQLCATFDTTNLSNNFNNATQPASETFVHPKGNYCFYLEIPAYLKKIPTSTPPPTRIYTTQCGKYTTVEDCNNSSYDGRMCAWYFCKNICLTTGTNVKEVCNSNVQIVTE